MLLYNTKLSTALALRRPEEAIDFLYVNNKWDDARVIANIEDSAFRAQYSPKGCQLAPELDSILS
jgi:hypothetical protein